MKGRTFTWVVLLSAALAGAAWFYLGREAPPPDLQGKLLFPDLRPVLTGARAIEITTAEQSFTLESGDSGAWSLRERHGYPAQAATVRRFLLGVAGLAIRSRKTSNPDNYARMDLNDPEDGASQAVRVLIRDQDGGQMAAFLAGKIRPASEVDNPEPGRGESGLKDLNQIFVRLPEAPTVWLVEGELDIAREPLDYLDRDRLTDTARTTIREVAVTRPGADAITVTRAAQGEDFELRDIPDGMRLKNRFQLNDLVDLFVNLRFEDVNAADEVNWDGGLAATMTAFDRSRVVMEQGQSDDGQSWIRLRAEDPPAAEEAEDAEEAAEAGNTEAAAEPGRATALNQRWNGWAYRLPEFRLEALNRGMEELIEEDEVEGESEVESQVEIETDADASGS